MPMRKTLLLLLLISGMCFPQNNLKYFIEKALANNPGIQEYSNLRGSNSLQSRIDEAENFLPHINLSANYLFAPYFNNDGKFVTSSPGDKAIGYDAGISNGGLYALQLNIDKTLFNGSLTDALKKQNTIQDRVLQNSITASKHELERQVTEQYISAYQSLLLNRLAVQTVANLHTQLRITEELVKSGQAKQSDYLLLDVEYENLKLALNESVSQYKTGMSQLLALCGIADTLAGEISNPDLTLNNPRAESQFLEKYSLDSNLIAAQQSLSEAKYAPQVKVFFNTGLNATSLDAIQRKFGFSAGLDFSLPLYDGNQRSLVQQQNELAKNSVGLYRSNFVLQKNLQQNTILSQLDILKNSIAGIEKQISAYNKIIDLKGDELRKGQSSMLEYLTILKNFIDLQKNKINAESNYQLQICNYNYWNW
jgi:outer membrane protein TolC